MAQFSVKLITYDPGIIEAFERLRKSRKHAAFTHEALKYFLASEKGRKVVNLMSNDNLPPLSPAHDYTNVKLPQSPDTSGLNVSSSNIATESYCDVMENILK